MNWTSRVRWVACALGLASAFSAWPLSGLLMERAAASSAGVTLVAWGDSSYGERDFPPGLSDVKAISVGSYRSALALKADGTVVAWGEDDRGDTRVPAGLSGVIAISAAPQYSLALKSDGTIVAIAGQGHEVPAGLSGVVAISAGGGHDLALKRDGTVVAWGDNSLGQTNVPAGLSDVVAVSAGNDFSLALRRDGTVVGWGNNRDGQINVPDGLSGATAISAGGFSLAIVGPGGSAGGAFPSSILLAVAIPLGLIAIVAAIWRKQPNVAGSILRHIAPSVRPTAIALVLALLSLPVVALTIDATDAIGNRAPATALGQWTAAAGGVLISALVAGTIGGLLVRRNTVGGAALTFVIALLVAIPASTLVPLVLGQSVGLGWFCLDSCGPVVGTNDLRGALFADLYSWFAPVVEPVPVAALGVGIGLWALAVRRLPAP